MSETKTTAALFDDREAIESLIVKRIDELSGRKGRMSVADEAQINASVFAHIKMHERGQTRGVDPELHSLLTNYCDLTRRLYANA